MHMFLKIPSPIATPVPCIETHEQKVSLIYLNKTRSQWLPCYCVCVNIIDYFVTFVTYVDLIELFVLLRKLWRIKCNLLNVYTASKVPRHPHCTWKFLYTVCHCYIFWATTGSMTEVSYHYINSAEYFISRYSCESSAHDIFCVTNH